MSRYREWPCREFRAAGGGVWLRRVQKRAAATWRRHGTDRSAVVGAGKARALAPSRRPGGGGRSRHLGKIARQAARLRVVGDRSDRGDAGWAGGHEPVSPDYRFRRRSNARGRRDESLLVQSAVSNRETPSARNSGCIVAVAADGGASIASGSVPPTLCARGHVALTPIVRVQYGAFARQYRARLRQRHCHVRVHSSAFLGYRAVSDIAHAGTPARSFDRAQRRRLFCEAS
jgi:hypothetical protein